MSVYIWNLSSFKLKKKEKRKISNMALQLCTRKRGGVGVGGWIRTRHQHPGAATTVRTRSLGSPSHQGFDEGDVHHEHTYMEPEFLKIEKKRKMGNLKSGSFIKVDTMRKQPKQGKLRNYEAYFIL